MTTQTSNLFLLEDLEDLDRTNDLPNGDVVALQEVADWVKGFIARPHEALGRAGPVCPFVPGSLERRTLWLAPEHAADRSVVDVIELMTGYKGLLADAGAAHDEDAIYDVIVVVFPDLTAARAQGLFDEVLEQLAVPSYVEEGMLFGPFHPRSDGTAIYNPSFQPFRSPVPFLFVRHGVLTDWKFFLDKEDWLSFWARRFGESAVQALAEELRRLPWREDAATANEHAETAH